MAKVKYDVRNAEVRNFEVPKPGVYEAAIAEMEHGTSSSNNAMFTVVFEVTSGEAKGARIWYYILTDGTQDWRLREFTEALGLPLRGEIDPAELKGSVVQLRTGIDPAKDGYDEKARVKNVLPAGKNGASAEEEEEEPPYDEWSTEDLKEEVEARELKITGRATKQKLVKALEADDEAAEAEEEEAEEEEEEEGDEEALTRAELDEMDRNELKALIKEEELEIKVTRSVKDDDLRDKIAEALEIEEEEEEEEEEGEDEEEADYTMADLEKLDRAGLRALIKEEELDVKVTRSLKDDALREKVAEALEIEKEEEGDDEEEEADTDYEEWDVSDLKAALKERGLKQDGRKSVLVARLKKDDESEDEEPF